MKSADLEYLEFWKLKIRHRFVFVTERVLAVLYFNPSLHPFRIRKLPKREIYCPTDPMNKRNKPYTRKSNLSIRMSIFPQSGKLKFSWYVLIFVVSSSFSMEAEHHKVSNLIFPGFCITNSLFF